MVSEYSGLNFIELQNLEFDTFQLLLRDAFIYKLEKTESGKEYLETAYILEQDKPDRESLREKYKGGA